MCNWRKKEKKKSNSERVKEGSGDDRGREALGKGMHNVWKLSKY